MSGGFDEARKQRDEIERYRQRHQGLLLERASEHFAVLTQGSFAGLRADFNEKDEPVLWVSLVRNILHM